MNEFLLNARQALTLSGQDVINIVLAVLILILGWFAAKIIAGLFRKYMKKMTFMRRFFDISGVQTSPDKVINIASKILYFVILLMAVIAALDVLNLQAISEPLRTVQ